MASELQIEDFSPIENSEARQLARCELDAAMFHVYGVNRESLLSILDSFSVLRKHEGSVHDEYQTCRMILEVFDSIQCAIDNSNTFQSPLDDQLETPISVHVEEVV